MGTIENEDNEEKTFHCQTQHGHQPWELSRKIAKHDTRQKMTGINCDKKRQYHVVWDADTSYLFQDVRPMDTVPHVQRWMSSTTAKNYTKN